MEKQGSPAFAVDSRNIGGQTDWRMAELYSRVIEK